MMGATGTVEVQNLVFSKWKEVKHKAEPHNYIEFFLVTDTENEVLAISAEDHGNSHYVYQSTGAFAKYGTLNSKNRADTISWLEMVIKDSQIKVDSQLASEVAHAGEPTPDNPLGLYYTQHRVEKTANPDGTHTQRFFLLDQYGTWHLAVVGEERETRDGHYLYKATEEFSVRYPLSCHAQKDVIHWLEQRVTHNRPPLAGQRKHDCAGSVGTSVGAAGSVGSGPSVGPPSGGSADACGQGCPGLGVSGGLMTAATPTSAFDGSAASDGAGVAPYMNNQPISPQQHQASGSTGSPSAAGAADGIVPVLHYPRQQLQQQTLGAAYPGMQADGAVQGTSEPQVATAAVAQSAASMQPPASSLLLTPQHPLGNHVGATTPLSAKNPTGTFPTLQQNSDTQNLGPETIQKQLVQPQNHIRHQQLFGNSLGHASAATQASGAASPLVSLQQHEAAIQQQQQQQQHQDEAAAAPATLPVQQGTQAQTAAMPPQPTYALQSNPFPQQGMQGRQPVLSAEPQGLAQLLAGLAASMPGVGAPSQIPGNGPPLQLQLPLPAQLQLQGSHVPLAMGTPGQQQQQQASSQLQPLQQFMAPSLFQLPQPEQQQSQLPFHALDSQTQLQQQQLHYLQQQLQQRQQELQKLLQSNTATLGLNNAAPGQQLSVQGTPFQMSSPTLLSLPGLPQPWNPSGSANTAACGSAQQQSMELPAMLPSAAQGGLVPAAVQVAASSQEFGSGPSPGSGPLDGLNPKAVALTGPALAQPFSQLALNAMPLSGGVSAVAGGGSSRMPGQIVAASGGCSGAATVNSLHGLNQQSQQQSQQQAHLQVLGQAGGIASMPGGLLGVTAVGSGNEVYAGANIPGGGGANPMVLNAGASVPVVVSSAPPPAAKQSPSAMELSTGLGPGETGVSACGTPTPGPLSQPFASATAQPTAPGSLLPGVRHNKEAGSGPAPGSGHHGGRGGGRGSSGKHKLAGVAEVAHKRKLARLAAAGEEAVRLAQGAYLAALRHQAMSEAAQQEALRKTIASWVRGQISDDEVSVNGWHENLEQILHDANCTRTLEVPFLSNERLLEVTRGSVEAIALAAAVSLTAPYDPTIPFANPPPSAGHPLVPAPTSDVAIVDVAVAPPSGPVRSSGGGEFASGSAAATAAANGAQPSTAVLCNAEAMAAVSSLKALLMGDLQAAVLGQSSQASGPQPAHGSQQMPAPPGDGIAACAGAVAMDMDDGRPVACDGQAHQSAVAALSGGPPSSVLATNGAPGLSSCAGAANTDLAAPDSNWKTGTQSVAVVAVSAQDSSPKTALSPLAGQETLPEGSGAELLLPPVQPRLNTPEAPGASGPSQLSPAQVQAGHSQPSALQQPCPLPLPIVPTRPSGPVGETAVLSCAGTAKSWAFPDPYMNKHGVRIALESLRELAALCPPVANMASSNLVDTVKKLEAHPHPSVSGLAKEILKRWRGSFIHRLRCMSDSRCYQDPVAALESKIQANEIVFPSLNELLGVPRGSVAAAAAEGSAGSIGMVTPATPAGPGPTGVHTPMTATPAGAGGGFRVAGTPPYSLATTSAPNTTGDTVSLAGLPTTPSLSFTGAGTPTLTAAATTAAAGELTNGSVTPIGGVATTTAKEVPQGLFDASLNGMSAPVRTPQLFSRQGGPAMSPVLLGRGIAVPDMPAALATQCPIPMSPPPQRQGTAAETPTTTAVPEVAAQVTAVLPMLPPPSLLRQPQPSTPGSVQVQMPSPLRQPPPLPAMPQLEAWRPPESDPATTATSVVTRTVLQPLGVAPTPSTPAAAPTVPATGQGHLVTQPSPVCLSFGTAPKNLGPSALPTSALPPHLLTASPLLPETTTADVAALLATSAQSLAAHMQSCVAAAASGGSTSPTPPSISPAQLSQLVTLASTAQAYTLALKTADAAGAASAWQSLVHQLRLAQTLTLGQGARAPGGALSQWALFMPSSSWSAATGTLSTAQPLQTSPQVQPLQIQPLHLPASLQAHVPLAETTVEVRGTPGHPSGQAVEAQPSCPTAAAVDRAGSMALSGRNGTGAIANSGSQLGCGSVAATSGV